MKPISLIEYENTDEKTRNVMDEHQSKGYRITNMKRTLLHSITAFQSLEDGFYNLQETLSQFLEEREILFFSYAISTEDDCIVCSTYFSDLLEKRNILFEGFTDRENALINYGRAIVNSKGHVSDDILDELQSLFTETQLVDITSFAVMLIANNLFNNALQVKSELLK